MTLATRRNLDPRALDPRLPMPLNTHHIVRRSLLALSSERGVNLLCRQAALFYSQIHLGSMRLLEKLWDIRRRKYACVVLGSQGSSCSVHVLKQISLPHIGLTKVLGQHIL